MGVPDTGEASGTILAGRYRVDGRLGTGGMGIVYRAIDLASGAPVAIKVLDHSKQLPSFIEQRFAREIATVRRLKSPHAVELLDAGTLPDGSPFMVMEHLEGADLHQILAQFGSLPVERAVRLIVQACAAIAEAHTLGIVHRDIKPANLFVTRGPDGGECVKVLDFGISKLPQMTMEEMALTCTGTVLGSPVYMSPEQMASSRNVDPRSDIWSLGIVLYELLSGQFPFEANSLPELCARVVTQEPLALSALVPVPPALEAAVMRCLSKDPAHRFARTEDLARALSPFAGESVSPPTIIGRPPLPPTMMMQLPIPTPPPGSSPAPARGPAVFVEPDTRSRARRIRLAGAAIGFAAGVIYLIATWPRQEQHQRTAADPRPAIQVSAPAGPR